MEEEIKVLEEFVKENRNWHCIECGYNCEKDMKTEQAIENLINKNKELEKERDGIYTDYQDLGKEKLELEKMVELMAKNIYNTSDTLNMLDIGKEINYDLEKLFNGIDDTEAIKIIIDYFRKKAKGG